MFVCFFLNLWPDYMCLSTAYTVVHSTHQCMCVTRVQYQYQDTSGWACTVLSCFTSQCYLHCPAHISHFHCLCRVEGGCPFCSRLYIYAQSLKLWTREWFVFALLMNVPSFFFALGHWLLFKSTAWTRKARDCIRVKALLPQDRSFVFFHFLLVILLSLLNHNQQAGTIRYLYWVALRPNVYIVNMYKCIQYC